MREVRLAGQIPFLESCFLTYVCRKHILMSRAIHTGKKDSVSDEPVAALQSVPRPGLFEDSLSLVALRKLLRSHTVRGIVYVAPLRG